MNEQQQQPNVPYQQYQQPYQPSYQPELEEPVSILDWIGSLLLINLVPCVGLIMCIVWAFSGSTKKSKANFCKAYLIFYIAVIVITVVFGAVFFGAIYSIIQSTGYPYY